MLAITEHVGLRQHVPIASDIEPPRSVRLDQPGHLMVKTIALGSGRHPNGLFVELVILGNVRARVVALPDILAVEQLHEVIGVRIVGDP